VRVVLASASPRRKELLSAILARFEVRASHVPEEIHGDPRGNAARLSLAKATAALAHDPGAIVLGSDTIVADEMGSLGKPEDAADAMAMLQRLAGKPHLVVTALTVATGGWEPITSLSETVVEMAPLTAGEIEAYVASGRPLDKAGAYAIQDEDVPTVRAWHGCYCGVMGLPLWRARDLLGDFGVPSAEPHHRLPRCAACPERTGPID
jgi:septum formation protein